MKNKIILVLFSLASFCVCFSCIYILGKGIHIDTMNDVYAVVTICSVTMISGSVSLLFWLNATSIQPWFGTRKLEEKKIFCILHPDHFKIVAESAAHWKETHYEENHSRIGWHRKNPFNKVDGYIMHGFKLNKSKDTTDFDFFNPQLVVNIFVGKEFYDSITREMKDNSWKGYCIETVEFGTAYEKFNRVNLPRFVYFVSKKIRPMSVQEVDSLNSVINFVAALD